MLPFKTPGYLPGNNFIFLKLLNLISETAAKTGMVMVLGEVTSNAHVDYPNVIRETIKHIGYDDAAKGKFFPFLMVHQDTK